MPPESAAPSSRVSDLNGSLHQIARLEKRGVLWVRQHGSDASHSRGPRRRRNRAPTMMQAAGRPPRSEARAGAAHGETSDAPGSIDPSRIPTRIDCQSPTRQSRRGTRSRVPPIRCDRPASDRSGVGSTSNAHDRILRNTHDLVKCRDGCRNSPWAVFRVFQELLRCCPGEGILEFREEHGQLLDLVLLPIRQYCVPAF